MKSLNAASKKGFHIVRRNVKIAFPRWLAALLLIVVLTLFWGMREQAVIRRSRMYHEISGETMGTFYHIKLAYSDISNAELERMRSSVEAELDAIEQSMSTYIEDSEISRFNAMPAAGTLAIGPRFRSVMARTLELCELTRGALDPSVGPLVELWGFGGGGRRAAPPAREEVGAALERVGWRRIELAPRGLSKSADGLTISLGAVAKGYAVDRLADVLSEMGAEDFLVEIGGELYADGVNSGGLAWRVGIDSPVLSALPGARLRGMIKVADLAVATSGDYRNYFETEDGRLYSHIIDPRSGRPVSMPPASVTVIAADCMTADALATALFVLGVEDGLEIVEKLDRVEALFIVSEPLAGLGESASSGFYDSTGYTPLAN